MNSPIKNYRIKNRLTQADFGLMVGLSQTAVALIENGTRKVNPANCSRYEQITGGELTRYDLRPDVFGEAPELASKPDRTSEYRRHGDRRAD